MEASADDAFAGLAGIGVEPGQSERFMHHPRAASAAVEPPLPLAPETRVSKQDPGAGGTPLSDEAVYLIAAAIRNASHDGPDAAILSRSSELCEGDEERVERAIHVIDLLESLPRRSD